MSKIKENTLSLNLPHVNTSPHITMTLGKQEASRSKSQRADSQGKEKESVSLIKMKNARSQILKIPKARQLLNMDKHVYVQDVQKRIQLLGDLRQQNYKPQLMSELHSLCKQKPQKKNRRHKTNFKVPLTQKNVERMNKIVQEHIDKNKKYMNEEVVILKQYEKTAPFDLNTLKFFDELNEVKRVCKERFKYDRGNLSKNNLVLQHVILHRNVKRQLNLQKKKQIKVHAKNVMDSL